METAIVAVAKVVDVSELTDRLTYLQFGDPSYCLLQRADAITDWKKEGPDAGEIREYTHGRLFGKNGEMRWKERIDGYSLLWLSEGDPPNGFTTLGEFEASAPQEVFLLGGGDTPPWRDTRIPRVLKYPLEWCEFPQVRVIQYKDRDSQTIRFTRYTEFVRK